MKNRKTLLLIVLIMVLMVSIGRETYALFTSSVDSVVQNFSTGTLSLSYSNSTVNISNAYPMSDIDGINTEAGVITITNTGTLAYKFDVKLEPSSSSTLPNDLIKVSLDEQIPEFLSKDNNIIIRDVILKPGSSRSFSIKLWIDSSASSSLVLGKSFIGNLTSTGIAVKNVEDSDGTVLAGLNNLYNMMLLNADVDTQIDFSQTSAASNTNGIYTTTSTDSGNPVYYYRGNVDNRVIFANYCWRIVRTTETGGVKLIYDGVPTDGHCNNTGEATTIGNSAFNSTYNDAKYVGYMYGSSIDDTNNTTDSTIKTVIDNWYQTNLSRYTFQLEDTVFCNDRTYRTEGSNLYFAARDRLNTNKTPTLQCANTKDKFTVDAGNGNGDLTYPIGLLSADEIAFAGGLWDTTNNSYYLYNNVYDWGGTPYNFTDSIAREVNVYSDGILKFVTISNSIGVRPVVSLKDDVIVSGGSGTATDPYVMTPPIFLYDIIRDNADTTTTINFAQTSKQSNTNGIYTTTSTDSGNPVYYYRGNVDNRLIFANFCWRIVRTTETGGVKIVYDGVPSNGQCNNTGSATTIGNSAFNSSYNSPADVGYMYGTRYTYKSKSASSLSGTIIFGNDITYSNGTYTLTDTYTVSDISNWSSERSTVGSRYHYTCFTNGTTCTTVNYSHYMSSSTIYYFELTGGKTHLDIINEMLDNSSNTTNSTIKTRLDNWYQTNLSSYTSQLEDTVFCNDRSYNVAGSGWDKDGSATSIFYFNARTRLETNKTPTLQCSSNNDKFTVNESNGNGDLTYPIGLLSADEIALAGGVLNTSNSSYYLYNNLYTWAGSPFSFIYSGARGFNVNSDGYLGSSTVNGSNGVRGAVSLKPGIAVSGGTGTATDPYIVE